MKKAYRINPETLQLERIEHGLRYWLRRSGGYILGEMNLSMFDSDEMEETKIEELPNYQILKILAENGSQKFTLNDFEDIYFDPSNGTHACFSAAGLYYELDCFALDDGGYAAILDIAETAHTYCTYLFRDGELTPTDGICPKPGLDVFFSNAKEFPKLVYDGLVSNIKSNNYWYIYDADEQILKTKLSLDVTDDNKWLLWKLEPEMPEIPYTWNGSQFVIVPEYEPTKQDTKIFENEW